MSRLILLLAVFSIHSTSILQSFAQDTSTPAKQYTGGFPGDFVKQNITLTDDNPKVTLNYASYMLSWDDKRFPLKGDMMVVRVNASGGAVQIRGVAQTLPQGWGPDKPRPLCQDEYISIWDMNYRKMPVISKRMCEQQTLDVLSYSDTALIQVNFYGMRPTIEDSWTLEVTRAPCGKLALRCPSDKTKCAQLEQICDGIRDCPKGEDEICTNDCGKPQIPADTAAPNLRIIGGVQAPITSWPWQVIVKNYDPTRIATCAGSVIGRQWVITAASCLVTAGNTAPDPTDVEVTVLPQWCNVGQSLRKLDPTITAQRVFLHPLFRTPGLSYDMAVLFLENDLGFADNGVQAVCLPRPNMGPLVGELCRVGGCGIANQTTGSTSTFKQANAPVFGAEACAKKGWNTCPDMICVYANGTEGICHQDNGGALACPKSSLSGAIQWHQFGVTSPEFNWGACEKERSAFFKVKWAMPFIAESLYAQNYAGYFSNRTVPVLGGPVLHEWEDETVVPQLRVAELRVDTNDTEALRSITVLRSTGNREFLQGWSMGMLVLVTFLRYAMAEIWKGYFFREF